MYDVRTDHQLLAFGEHTMHLFDRASGQIVVAATRDLDSQVWTIHAEGIDDTTAPTLTGAERPREQIIAAIIDHALAALPGAGYSAMIPHGLYELP